MHQPSPALEEAHRQHQLGKDLIHDGIRQAHAGLTIVNNALDRIKGKLPLPALDESFTIAKPTFNQYVKVGETKNLFPRGAT